MRLTFGLTLVALLVLAGCRDGGPDPSAAQGWKRIALIERWTLEVPEGVETDTLPAGGWNDLMEPGKSEGALAGENRGIRWVSQSTAYGHFPKSMAQPAHWGYRHTPTRQVQIGRRPFTSADSVTWSYASTVSGTHRLSLMLVEGLPGDSTTTLRILRSARFH